MHPWCRDITVQNSSRKLGLLQQLGSHCTVPCTSMRRLLQSRHQGHRCDCCLHRARRDLTCLVLGLSATPLRIMKVVMKVVRSAALPLLLACAFPASGLAVTVGCAAQELLTLGGQAAHVLIWTDDRGNRLTTNRTFIVRLPSSGGAAPLLIYAQGAGPTVLWLSVASR